VEVDSWAFERAVDTVDGRDAGDTAGPAGWEAARSYGDGVLTHQFTYDDSIESYRRVVLAAYSRLAARLLADPSSADDAGEVVALARQVSRVAPNDEDLCVLAACALAHDGRAGEARALVRRTEEALVELGLDPSEFAARARGALA
jgi:hypothetical protein